MLLLDVTLLAVFTLVVAPPPGEFPRALLLFSAEGRAPPMIDEMTAARAAVKFGSEAMAAVAALRVSAKAAFWVGCCKWAPSKACGVEDCRPENLDWLLLLWWLELSNA